MNHETMLAFLMGQRRGGGSSGGGEDSNWVLLDKEGEVMKGEVVEPGTYVSNYENSPHHQYRITLDGVSEVIMTTSVANASFTGGYFEKEEGDPTVYFDDGEAHEFKVEVWVGELPCGIETIPFTLSADATYIGSSLKTASVSSVTLDCEGLSGQVKGHPSIFGRISRNENSGALQFQCINFSTSSASLYKGDYELIVYYRE